MIADQFNYSRYSFEDFVTRELLLTVVHVVVATSAATVMAATATVTAATAAAFIQIFTTAAAAAVLLIFKSKVLMMVFEEAILTKQITDCQVQVISLKNFKLFDHSAASQINLMQIAF